MAVCNSRRTFFGSHAHGSRPSSSLCVHGQFVPKSDGRRGFCVTWRTPAANHSQPVPVPPVLYIPVRSLPGRSRESTFRISAASLFPSSCLQTVYRRMLSSVSVPAPIRTASAFREVSAAFTGHLTPLRIQTDRTGKKQRSSHMFATKSCRHGSTNCCLRPETRTAENTRTRA